MEEALENVIIRRDPNRINNDLIRKIVLGDIFQMPAFQIVQVPEFDLNDIKDKFVKPYFRFKREDRPRLARALHIPNDIRTRSGHYVSTGQQYYITGSPNGQFLPSSYRQQFNDFGTGNQEASPFRQNSPGFQHQQLDPYYPQRDLQTSDLPFHLQRTLPQYRVTTKIPPALFDLPSPNSFQSSPPAPFRLHSQPQQRQQTNSVIPSTHRPNYSHLFSRTHHGQNPADTETFLGEITLQSPPEFPPPKFNGDGFKPSPTPPHDGLGDHEDFADDNAFHFGRKAKANENSLGATGGGTGGGSRFNFLNHRTRIFAPNTDNKNVKVKDYFVTNEGDVFTTTKPAPRPPVTITPKDAFDIDSLLEEPIKNHHRDTSQSDDVVEVIKSVPTTEASNTTQDNASSSSSSNAADYDYETLHNSTSPYDDEYEEYEEEEEEHQKENHESNDLHAEHVAKPEHADEEYDYEEETSTMDTIMTNPVSSPKAPKAVTEESTKETPAENRTQADKTGAANAISNSVMEPELVVSVVTTKSVVNNTVIASEEPTVNVTTPPSMVRSVDNTTDTWMVVASIQTSRSVSGGRHIPPPPPPPPQVPESKGDEREKLLNEEGSLKAAAIEDTNSKEVEPETTTEEIQTTTLQSTTLKQKPSTESLTDKLDRVQSDLSSSLLNGGFENEGGNNIAVINETLSDKIQATTMFDLGIVSTEATKSTTAKSNSNLVMIKKFSANARPPSTKRPRKFPSFARPTPSSAELPQGDEAARKPDLSSLLPPGYKLEEKDSSSVSSISLGDSSGLLRDILSKAKLLEARQHQQSQPKPTSPEPVTPETTTPKANSGDEEPKEAKDETSKPPTRGFKPKSKAAAAIKIDKFDDISALLPPGYKSFKTSSTTSTTEDPSRGVSSKSVDDIIAKAKPLADISALLPPGYKQKSAEAANATSPRSVEKILSKSKPVDISAFLPPGYKPDSPKPEKPRAPPGLPAEAKPVDVSSFLPPGYNKPQQDSPKTKGVQGLLEEAKPVDISSFLPPGYKAQGYRSKKPTTAAEEPGSSSTSSTSSTSTSTTVKPTTASGFKVVFPSRPGGGARKSATRLTTPKYSGDGGGEENRVTPPTIHRGWPSRATTEFTGWPTPSTTPISIEKLLEAARAASTSAKPASVEVSSTAATTTTTTTTTTLRPTTPGICERECDLAGTIKLIGGAKWVPELLDRNTKEWQILANEIQTQLEDVYNKSNMLNKWYKKLRIDGFSEGSVLVDYLVELNDLGRQIDTVEIKKLFHDSLENALSSPRGVSDAREGKSLNETAKLEGKLALGQFIVDPKYTDFVVLPKQVYPTVGYAEDNVLLPQWAIAVIVIGLASLLFVIIFGVTVLVNRQKNAKKKTPTPLTDDMLNELNKNHMGGLDNYAAEDLYNMEDVWNDRGFDPKISRKRSSDSLRDNSMSNLYDSWRSEWNGYYYNAYYGNNAAPGSSSQAGYGRRRSDYDTNF